MSLESNYGSEDLTPVAPLLKVAREDLVRAEHFLVAHLNGKTFQPSPNPDLRTSLARCQSHLDTSQTALLDSRDFGLDKETFNIVLERINTIRRQLNMLI
ncbi:hypothetical protein ACFL21_02135 [Patescibacteria group bacterium]